MVTQTAQEWDVLGGSFPMNMPIRDLNGGGAFIITRYASSNAGFGFAGKIDDQVQDTGTIYVNRYGHLCYVNQITGKTTQLTSE